jgi:ABC-type lipoprotein release transport system permease subunit
MFTLRSYLFKTSATDPLVFGFTSLFLIFLCLLASSLPALRAASMHPLLALRSE